jgi:hypothetical protein
MPARNEKIRTLAAEIRLHAVVAAIKDAPSILRQ